MTNLKKLGLSAAGSLVATTGYAGALDVTGAAKVSYVSKDETEVTEIFSMTRILLSLVLVRWITE